ncbi:hypothetical protein KKF61_01270 [Patescibacteria group bacterium]|nr:hypothetical protein [Patescibacteria group bacterium]MBU0964071.1 hypothetical protein [Patescibacteria group bacterium]
MLRNVFIILMVLSLILMAGCERTVMERSEIFTEEVRVRDLIFTPSIHGTGVGPTLDLTGEGGLGIAVTSVSTKEKHSIVFECQHGGFVIEREELWKKLHEDSVYTCHYVNLFKAVYNGDQFVSRDFYDFDFLGLAEFPDLMEEPDPRHEVVN